MCIKYKWFLVEGLLVEDQFVKCYLEFLMILENDKNRMLSKK